MRLLLCVFLAALAAAQTTGSPFSNPAYSISFDSSNALIKVTFTNVVSYDLTPTLSLALTISDAYLSQTLKLPMPLAPYKPLYEFYLDLQASRFLAGATLTAQGGAVWLLSVPRAGIADGAVYYVTFINKPPAVCTAPTFSNIAASPTAVVGTGTAASCTFALLQSAIAAGGAITFNCGPQVVTIPFPSTIGIIRNVTIDGGSRIVFSGQNARRLFTVNNNPPDSQKATTVATFRNLVFINAKVNKGDSSSKTDGGGGAIYRVGAELNIDNCVFHNCHGLDTGSDQAGGAVYSFGGSQTVVSQAIVTGCSCSAGGGLGSLGTNIVYYNSILSGNTAESGNGGAAYFDGGEVSWDVCGLTIRKNIANAQGMLFRVGYNNVLDTVSVQKTWIDSNTGKNSAWFFQDLKLTMKDVTISNGVGPAHQFYQLGNYGLDIDYVTWYNNAYTGDPEKWSLAAAGAFSPNPKAAQPSATWTINHVTVFNNSALFASAFLFDSPSTPSVSNSAFENYAYNGYNPVNCNNPAEAGSGGVYQSPAVRAGGDAENGSLCATGATLIAGPLGLGPLGDQGCVVPTNSLLPGAALPSSVRNNGCAAPATGAKVTDVVTDMTTLLPVQWPAQGSFTGGSGSSTSTSTGGSTGSATSLTMSAAFVAIITMSVVLA